MSHAGVSLKCTVNNTQYKHASSIGSTSKLLGMTKSRVTVVGLYQGFAEDDLDHELQLLSLLQVDLSLKHAINEILQESGDPNQY